MRMGSIRQQARVDLVDASGTVKRRLFTTATISRSTGRILAANGTWFDPKTGGVVARFQRQADGLRPVLRYVRGLDGIVTHDFRRGHAATPS